MGKVIRLTENIAFEFQDTVSHAIQETGLHLYEFDNGNAQIVNNDSFKYNNRNMAYAPDDGGVLMRTTPIPYYPEEQHEANSLESIAPSATLDYWKCRLQYAAGYGYGKTWGIVVNISVLVNSKRTVRLAAIFDAKDLSKLTINERETILDNIVFNQGFEIHILDVNSLFAATDPEIVELRNKIFGSDAKEISEYRIEFAYISTMEAIGFTTSVGTFTRLQPVQTYTQYYGGQVIDDNLVAKLEFYPEDQPSIVRMSLAHNIYDVEQYLKRICQNSGSGFRVTHQLQITAYDINGQSLGSNVCTYSDPLTPFGIVVCRPWLADNILEQPIDHVYFELRSTFEDNVTGIQITRYIGKVIENLQIFNNRQVALNVETVKLYNKVEQIKQNITVKRDTPSIIEVPKNYVYQQPQGSTIVLTPFNNTIDIDLGFTVAETLYMCIGANRYPQMKINDTNALASRVRFNIPSAEYYKGEEKWYIVNSANECVTYGKIELQ